VHDVTANGIVGVLVGAGMAVAILHVIGIFAGPIVGTDILPYSKESTSGRLGWWMHGIWLGFAIAVPALGGYIAAAIAKVRPLFHGLFVGVGGALVVFLMSESWLMTVYALSLFPPSAVVGGWFWQRRQRRSNRAL